ncbi:hypothetical protein PtB15_17B75 [Puccinia triticina]|nr:hypothetical protein PtB15_17B75 [Puccinia triticina]
MTSLTTPDSAEGSPRPAAIIGLPRTVSQLLEMIVNLFALLVAELGQLRQNIRALFGSDHQQLNSIASCFLPSPQQGKHLRPLIAQGSAPSAAAKPALILPTQGRVAEIAELIHVSSLLHDDVINKAESCRGEPSVPLELGSQLSVLAGNLLLTRSFLSLSRPAKF